MMHRQEHAVGSTSDHTDTGYTQGNLVAYDANGLPAADGGDPDALVTMQNAYDNAEGITFSKYMNWDLNAAYGFLLQEGTDNVSIQATAENSILFTGQVTTFTMDAAVSISLDSANTSNFTLSADDAADKTLTIEAQNIGAGNGNIQLTAGYEVGINAALVDVNATVYELNSTSVSIDCLASSNFTMTANSSSDRTLTIQTSNAGSGSSALALISDKTLSMSSTEMDVDGTDMTIDMTATMSIQSSENSDITLAANATADHTLTIQTSNAGTGSSILALISDKDITMASMNLDIDVTDVTIDATSAFSIQGALDSDLTMHANSFATRTLTISALNDNGLASAVLSLNAKTYITSTINTREVLRCTYNAVVVNDGGVDVDFRIETPTSSKMVWVNAGDDVVGIDAANLGVGAYAPAAALNISDSTWLVGETIYDCDFSLGYSTPATMQDIGIAMTGESGHPTFLANYGFDTGNAVTTSDWQYITSTGWTIDNWSTARQVSVMSWPLNRGDNWQILVDFDAAAMPTHLDEVTLNIGVMGLGGYVSFYARCRCLNSIIDQYYNAELWTNDGYANGFTKEYDGTPVASTGSYKLGLRCWNGVLAVYDDQDDSWHEYTGRFGDSATGDGTTFGILHAFIALGEANDAEASEKITITNLNFKYLK